MQLTFKPRSPSVIVVLSTLVASVILAGGCSSQTTGSGSPDGAAGKGGAGGSPSNNGAAGGGPPNSGGASGTCTEYGIKFAQDCTQCPTVPLTCPCLAGLQGAGLYWPQTSCTFGSCVSAVDCGRVCKNAPLLISEASIRDVGDINRCVAELSLCQSGDDRECGDGKCVWVPEWGTGKCSAGVQDNDCKEPNDCQTGFFCVGIGVCVAGKPGSPCDTNDQCPGGTCVQYTPGPDDIAIPTGARGLCTAGLANQPCTMDAQCAAGTHCVPGFSTSVLGACSPGGSGDP